MIHIIPHLIIKKNNEILLLRRAVDNRIWGDHWHCVTGTIELGETPQQAIAREAKEEVGIDIIEPELITTLSVDQNSILNPGERFRSLELFFLYHLQDNDIPTNVESDKHSALEWFKIDILPTKIIPHVQFGINNFTARTQYSEYKL
jgi:8-oxo-dGTP diphosphatase